MGTSGEHKRTSRGGEAQGVDSDSKQAKQARTRGQAQTTGKQTREEGEGKQEASTEAESPKETSGQEREAPQRPKRERRAETYDEKVRRSKRRKTENAGRYMESSRKRTRRGELKHGIQITAVTVERIVRGRYEWRDGDLVRTETGRKWSTRKAERPRMKVRIRERRKRTNNNYLTII